MTKNIAMNENEENEDAIYVDSFKEAKEKAKEAKVNGKPIIVQGKAITDEQADELMSILMKRFHLEEE